MAKRTYTKEQLDAINVRGRSVIVSAAAGSGKTSVLVERLLRIICDTEDQIPVESIVVVTFTRAAAAEMKQRLSVGLNELLVKNHNIWLERQASLLSTAYISTIHSFCFSLIREHIQALDLAADFRVADTSEEKIFADTVLDELMRELYKTDPEDMEMLRDCFCGTNDKRLAELIKELHSCLTAIPFFEAKLERLPELYSSGIFVKKYTEYLGKRLYSCRDAVNEVLHSAQRLGDEKLIGVLSADMQTADKLISIYENGSPAELLELLGSITFKTFPRKSKNTPDPEKLDEIKAARDEYKKTLQGFGECRSILLHADEDLDRHAQIMRALSKIIIRYDRALLDYKIQKNAISFDDAETLTLRLLAEVNDDGVIERTPLGEKISGYYSFIMVDEFQDTNDRQDMIFRLLSHGGSPKSYGDNLFFVGDVKQAIYRFRQANPENFLNVQNSAKPYREGETGGACIKLNKNFRSSPDVIDFVNFVFKNIMSEKCGGIDYNEDSFLVNGSHFCDAQRSTGIILFEKDKDDESREAEAAARKIRSLIDAKTPVSLGSGSSRPCEMRDFCILMRGKGKNNIYADALKKYGLDANFPDASGYLESHEIAVLINLLRIIDNPLLDIPMASVMMSPMFLFTPDEMVKIRLAGHGKKLYSLICKISDDEAYQRTEPELCEKIRSFRGFAAELRTRSTFSALPELIEYIYERTDFTSVVQLGGDAERKRANLRLLLEYANSFERVYASGVHGFVRYIARVMESGGNFESFDSGDSSRNAVSIKTMHKSKGLEFPFVFICGTSTGFNKADESKVFQFSDTLGVGFRMQNKEKLEKYKTIAFEVIKNSNAAEAKSEELRLLYVALTRAKERLFITLDVSDKSAERARSLALAIHRDGGITPQLAGSAVCMQDWLMMSLLLHPLGAPLRERFEIFESFCADDRFPIAFESGDDEAASSESIQPEKVKDTDSGTADRILERFGFVYDSSYVEAISKFSVSDLAKTDDDFPVILGKPPFACEDGMTAAEKGTAVHCFLQFADFPDLIGHFEQQRDQMVSVGHLTPRQGKAVRKEDIEAFTRSEIYELILKSERIYREHQFLVSIEDLDINDRLGIEYKGTDGMLNGIMDMIIENKDGLIIVDYKTDHVNSMQELLKRYSGQLWLYKRALEATQDKPVTALYIYSFAKCREIRL